jgi:hypothetical protein
MAKPVKPATTRLMADGKFEIADAHGRSIGL